MIRVLVMANDSLLADAIGSILAEEIDLDDVWLTHRELGQGHSRSLVIMVDEGEPAGESNKVANLFWDPATLLMIMISLKSRNLYMYECYQLVTPEMEQVIHILREFSRMNLKKKAEEEVKISALQNKMAATPFQVLLNR